MTYCTEGDFFQYAATLILPVKNDLHYKDGEVKTPSLSFPSINHKRSCGYTRVTEFFIYSCLFVSASMLRPEHIMHYHCMHVDTLLVVYLDGYSSYWANFPIGLGVYVVVKPALCDGWVNSPLCCSISNINPRPDVPKMFITNLA